jgi:hypothetical protein
MSLRYPEYYITLQRAARRCNGYEACGRTLGNRRRQVGVGLDREVCRSLVEGDGGGRSRLQLKH